MKDEFITLDDLIDYDLMDSDEEGEDLSLFDDDDECMDDGFEEEDDLDDFSSFGFF